MNEPSLLYVKARTMGRRQPGGLLADGCEQDWDLSSRVHALVKQLLSDCSYAYYFNKVTWRYDRGTLTLEGCVPTFYLKQILQTMLRDLEHVQQIANQVDVVSSTGLSSARAKLHE